MYKNKGIFDTIAAIATPFGIGGIGLIRLSGSEAISIADNMFSSKKGKPSLFVSHTVHLGNIVQKRGKRSDLIDEVMLTVMRGPKSYTKEDVVEISCHGGQVAMRSILALAIKLGARLSEPGEFTKRAFLNGRIDLTQAEAVLDMINSNTDVFLQFSVNQLKGDLALQLEAIRGSLLEVYTDLEGLVNFPEDGIEEKGKKDIFSHISSAKKEAEKLLEGSEQGKLLKDGIKIVICGRPNVGKSSLLNALLRHPRAIVSDIPGTTRDTIEENITIKGLPFHIIDTAGIVRPRDRIEEEALKRSRMNIDSADLLIAVFDGSAALSKEDKGIISKVKSKNYLAVLNKSDLKSKTGAVTLQKFLEKRRIISVSALKRLNISKMEEKIIYLALNSKKIEPHKMLISNMRHIEALGKCRDCLKRALEALQNEVSFEFVSEEIKSAVNFLDNITGRNIDNDLLDQIFSRFCIGK
ncbi:MAG: tRNA uridine-5-carboxymethylaminomethyl(34) synthesis GTPase MnmE [Candidatus Omnitrophica bacterium]|nr:tRNA uridine-5-carboxymethylaminomethyl(34) synthesis GTPase MnmE [Candidatus Omnitrophota bacterium]